MVEFTGLVLAQAVERLVRFGSELRAHRPCAFAFHLDGDKRHCAFLQQRRAVRLEELQGARSLVDFHHQAVGRQTDLAAGFGHFEGTTSLLRHHGQACAVGKRAFRDGRYPDDLRCDDLQPDLLIPAGNRHLVVMDGKGFLAGGRQQERRQQQQEEYLFHSQFVRLNYNGQSSLRKGGTGMP